MPARPSHSVTGRRSSQLRTTSPKTIATRFSGVVIGPMAARIERRCRLTASLAGMSTGNTTRVSRSHATGSMMNVTGIPTSIQRAKLIWMP